MFFKKFLIFIFCFVSIFCVANEVFAADKEVVEFNFFYSKTCPNCVKENTFLEKLEAEYDGLQVNRFITSEGDNWKILLELYDQYKVPEKINGLRIYGGVPISFVGERYFLGYKNDETTGQEIENYIKNLLGEAYSISTTPLPIVELEFVSFLGKKIDLEQAPPLFLAVVLGILDGFNACAMVALAFLLTMLIATGIRRRVVIIGGTFILVSGIVYFLFVSAWLNLFLVSKNLGIITTIAGVVILIFAIFLLRDYILGIVCRICRIESDKESITTKTQRGLFAKLRKLTEKDIALPLLILGVAVIAIGINSIEFVCSFGFPLVFTKILSGLELSNFAYYFYIFIYIFFYMLDDFIIFLLAVFTLKITGISEKYLRIMKLVSAIVLLALGLILLIKPELLTLI